MFFSKYCLLFLLLFSSCISVTTAQKNAYTTPKDASEKTKEAYKKAYSYISQSDFNNAIKELEKLLKKDPVFIQGYIELGSCYEAQNNYEKAIANFNKAISLGPDYQPKVYLSLGRIATKQENYPEVEKQLTKFLSYKNNHPDLVNLATKRLGDARFIPKALANPVKFEPKNLGSNINSANREYFPSVTLEDELVYTIQFGEGQAGQEDLYISKYEEGEWQKSSSIKSINTPENEAAQTISADGKLLVFTVCNRKEDYGSCDLYFSRKINGVWTPAKNIGKPINSLDWESQPSIAPNGEAIYFVRGGAKGQGHKDLFISKLQVDGTWGVPENIAELNTPYDESSPSIHPDGQTLYFSSNGHPGIGGFDLFISRKQEDGGEDNEIKWGAPVNLGYPINTKGQEEALAVNRKGSVAYLASDRAGGLGSFDIYSFELPEHAKPKPVTFIKGFTMSAETRNPMSADVEIVELHTQKVFAKFTTSNDGNFIVCLPVGEYALNAKQDGFLFFSENYNLTEAKSLDLAYWLEARLQPIVYKGDDATKKVLRQPIVLKNVFFSALSAELKQESMVELDKLKTLLDENPNMKIQLNGHTDNVGKPEDNLKLSNDRALAVLNYLIKKGITKDRLKSQGFGETMPISDNNTEEGKAENRRTEFELW